MRRMLNDVLQQEKHNLPHEGRDLRRENRGRPVEIEPGSVDEVLLADWMEDNLGFRQTTHLSKSTQNR